MLEKIEEEIRNCRKCPLWKERKNAVPGDGNKNAEIMIVGEAPGRVEDEMGKPFVGKAGQLLTEILKKNGMEREDVYITNVVKCRPPGNRNPKQEEIEKCLPYLERQIDAIQPEIIITLGNFATSAILEMYGFKAESITRIRGRVLYSPIHSIKIIPTFHPAACIYNRALVEYLEKDVEMAKNFLTN